MDDCNCQHETVGVSLSRNVRPVAYGGDTSLRDGEQALTNIILEGDVTVLHDEEHDEMLIAYNPDTTASQPIVDAMTLAASMGFGFIGDEWFDVDTARHISILRKEVQA